METVLQNTPCVCVGALKPAYRCDSTGAPRGCAAVVNARVLTNTITHMSLQVRLICLCWPGKQFATPGSLRTRRLSQRHKLHEVQLEFAAACLCEKAGATIQPTCKRCARTATPRKPMGELINSDQLFVGGSNVQAARSVQKPNERERAGRYHPPLRSAPAA